MKKTSLSDNELILGYLAGNDSCFKTLLLRHKNKVFSTIYAVVNDRYIAEEIFQETFIKACNLRKAKNKPTITDSEGNDIFSYLIIKQDSAEDSIIKREDKSNIRNLIKLLPVVQQEVIIMRHYGDMSFKEIAEATQVSVNTALGRMRYALLNLRKMLIQQEMNVQ